MNLTGHGITIYDCDVVVIRFDGMDIKVVNPVIFIIVVNLVCLET